MNRFWSIFRIIQQNKVFLVACNFRTVEEKKTVALEASDPEDPQTPNTEDAPSGKRKRPKRKKKKME